MATTNPHITKELLDLYFNHVLPNVSFYGNKFVLDKFKELNPVESAFLISMTNKRSKIRKNLTLMKHCGDGHVAWFTLTFNDNKNDRELRTKQKEVINFLNECFVVWLFVEEYGGETERYHIHGFGIFSHNKTMCDDFFKWHSIEEIEILKGKKLDKKVKYLTKYVSKDIPTIHRSKSLIKVEKVLKGPISLFKSGFYSTGNRRCNEEMQKLNIRFIPFVIEEKYRL